MVRRSSARCHLRPNTFGAAKVSGRVSAGVGGGPGHQPPATSGRSISAMSGPRSGGGNEPKIPAVPRPPRYRAPPHEREHPGRRAATGIPAAQGGPSEGNNRYRGSNPTGDLMSRVYAGPRRYPVPGTSCDAYRNSPQLRLCRTFAIQMSAVAAVAPAATAPGPGSGPGSSSCPGLRALGPPGRPVRTPGSAEPVRQPHDGPVRVPRGLCREEARSGAGTLFSRVSGWRCRPLRVEAEHLHGICGRSAQLPNT